MPTGGQVFTPPPFFAYVVGCWGWSQGPFICWASFALMSYASSHCFLRQDLTVYSKLARNLFPFASGSRMIGYGYTSACCQNASWTRMTPTDTPKCMNKNPIRPQPYMKNYRQLKKAGSKRGGPFRGRVHQLFVQCQMVSPENIHVRNITWTEQIIYRNIYCIYTYACNNSRWKKRLWIWRRVGEVFGRVWREEREERVDVTSLKKKI